MNVYYKLQGISSNNFVLYTTTYLCTFSSLVQMVLVVLLLSLRLPQPQSFQYLSQLISIHLPNGYIDHLISSLVSSSILDPAVNITCTLCHVCILFLRKC